MNGGVEWFRSRASPRIRDVLSKSLAVVVLRGRKKGARLAWSREREWQVIDYLEDLERRLQLAGPNTALRIVPECHPNGPLRMVMVIFDGTPVAFFNVNCATCSRPDHPVSVGCFAVEPRFFGKLPRHDEDVAMAIEYHDGQLAVSDPSSPYPAFVLTVRSKTTEPEPPLKRN